MRSTLLRLKSLLFAFLCGKGRDKMCVHERACLCVCVCIFVQLRVDGEKKTGEKKRGGKGVKYAGEVDSKRERGRETERKRAHSQHGIVVPIIFTHWPSLRGTKPQNNVFSSSFFFSFLLRTLHAPFSC